MTDDADFIEHFRLPPNWRDQMLRREAPASGTEALRDWFAGMALEALVSSVGPQWTDETFAAYAYNLADAMLKIRNERKPREKTEGLGTAGAP